MNLKKILKIYLIFILTITGMSILGNDLTIKKYYNPYFLSVIHLFDDKSDLDVKPSDFDWSVFIPKNANISVSAPQKPISNDISFEITNEPEKAYASPGDIGIEIMKLNFKTKDKGMKLKSLKLKVVGAEREKIVRLFLTSGDKFVALGRPSDNYFKFDYINYEIAAASEGSLSVRIDLSENLQTHDRIRLDIENPEDIELTIDEKPYKIIGYYPIEGKYLSIALRRPWIKYVWVAPSR